MSGMHRGPGIGSLTRSAVRSEELGDHRLKPGTVRRVIGFARPFVGLITVFVITVVLTAVFAVLPPLLFKQIIDNGVLAGNARLVVVLAVVVAVLAVAEAAVGLLQRWW